jgi:Uncharacterized conserved protein (DUF2358)
MRLCHVVEGESNFDVFAIRSDRHVAFQATSRVMLHQDFASMELVPDSLYRTMRLQRKRSTTSFSFCQTSMRHQAIPCRRQERLLWSVVVAAVVSHFAILSVECFVAIVFPSINTQRRICQNSHRMETATLGRRQSSLFASNEKSQLRSESPLVIADAYQTTTTAVAIPFQDRYADVLLSPWEQWCVGQLQERYDQALSIKCPFFRRRASDLLDAMDMIVRFIVIRHKSLPDYAMLPTFYSPRRHKDMVSQANVKFVNITQDALLSILRDDWNVETQKGYYITGKLTTAIYSDDALFDGPDPDMPVRGLYKYVNAASQLFEVKSSYSELLDIYIESDTSIVARWKLYGKLRLPWKPVVPAWTGTTTYHIDPRHGLIDRHIETWDISVWKAFLQTLCPPIARQIWH